MSVAGSCLCQSVRYEIDGELLDAGNCHCSMCRKLHGAAFATYATVSPESFRWTSGEDLVTAFESSPGQERLFCAKCGSSLAGSTEGRIDAVTPGTIDGDPGIRPRSHIFVGSKAEWHEINDDLPCFDEWPPGEGWA